MGKGSNTSTSQSSSAPDAQAGSLYRSLLTQAQGVASTPYQSYTGELTAPVNAQQTAGINNINSNAGFATPYIQQAAGMVSNAANPLTADQIQQYQNPYTQQVVDATQASFAKQNAQQQAGLTGNSIAQGALGGNRVGVAQANLAGQQSAAQAPVIAGLYNQGYNQAVQTAGQQFQQNPMNAAYGLGNLGVSGQTAALSGAGAQLGAGTLQQQTQQAGDTANYGQFMQQQAYPYQQLQWLAGLGTGVGSQLGGTSSGTSTAPAPNQAAQWAGLGLSAASLFMRDGGRVAGFADGGAPTTPYGGGPSWIPQIGIHAGSGAPQAHAPSSPSSQAPSIDTSKIIGLANGLSGKLSGPQYGGGSWWAGDAYGGSSSNPLPGLDASDYGIGYRHGGGVAGFADGGAPGTGFMDVYNGDPSWMDPDVGAGYARPKPQAGFDQMFAERSSGLSPARKNPGFVSSYMDATGQDPRAYVDDVPLPRARPADAPTGPTMVAQGEDDDEAAPAVAGVGARGASPGAGVGAATVGDGGPTALGFAPETPSRRKPSFATDGIPGLFGFEAPSDSVRSGLLAAGLGMLASRSPNFGNAVGEGGLAGFGAYSSSVSAQQKVQSEAAKLARDAEKAAKDLELRTRAQTETERHNKASEAKEFKPTYGVIGKDADPVTGIVKERYGWIDPNTRSTSEVKPSGPAAGAAGRIDPALTGNDYLKELEKNNPELARTVKAVGDYRSSVTSLSQRGGLRERVLEAALRYNPDYDQTQFSGKNRAVGNFAGGPEGRTVRSLNVAIDHLNTLDEAAKALKNGDIPALNSVVNYFRTKTGSPLATNFDSIKQVVSAEIAKAVVGGQTALHDRDDMAKRAGNSGSPEQLGGIITEFKKLMAGQMKGLRRQYESTTKLKNFDDFLEPHTKAELERVSHSEGTGDGGAKQVPPISDRPPGIYNTPAKGPMRWTGTHWENP